MANSRTVIGVLVLVITTLVLTAANALLIIFPDKATQVTGLDDDMLTLIAMGAASACALVAVIYTLFANRKNLSRRKAMWIGVTMLVAAAIASWGLKFIHNDRIGLGVSASLPVLAVALAFTFKPYSAKTASQRTYGDDAYVPHDPL